MLLQPRHTKGSLWRLLKDIDTVDDELGIDEPDLRNLRGSGRRGRDRGGGRGGGRGNGDGGAGGGGSWKGGVGGV